jgi:hypothetical protein
MQNSLFNPLQQTGALHGLDDGVIPAAATQRRLQ